MTISASPETTLRSHYCGTLGAADVGRRVRLGGWVHRRRDLGGLVFIDLRDRTGMVQISLGDDAERALHERAASVGTEYVLLVEGEVVARAEGQRNPELTTGDIEVRPTSIEIVGPATTPVIPVARGKGEPLPSEDLRLRHRHLDLRRPELQANLILRHRIMQETRRYFSDHGFLEVETPILTKPTPEGARDYLVPSRVHAGEFYALPQSPQLYKQLLMMSGFDRYFQIARCFRDEDLRADRQPEFTQIDVEAAFVTRDDVIRFTEELLTALWRTAGREIETPFPRIAYAEAMERFGSDRPDLRYELEITDLTDVFRVTEFGIARSAIESGGRVRGIRVPGGAAFSRKQVDELEALAKGAGAGGLIRVRSNAGVLEGPAAKFFGDDGASVLGLADGELLLAVAAPDHISSPALDRVRQEVARRMEMIPAGAQRFLWVLDFPMFERDPSTGSLGAVHHPFTSPMPEDVPLLDSDPAHARAQAYDVVLNGTELGGGSIRIADPELQQRIFGLLGIDDQTALTRFGFLLEGLRAGAPPHGGIALGLDRIAMLLSGAQSLREVIAFPKTTAARALFEGAPTAVTAEDMRDLHLRMEV